VALEALQVVRGRQETVPSDERESLCNEDAERDQIDESQEAEDDEAGEPVRRRMAEES